MDTYREHLAIEVLNEDHAVTYRALSRAVKVHCNIAKQMLYEFHRSQNARKPGSVHATYLVSGFRPLRPKVAASTANGELSHDGDTVMQSSPQAGGLGAEEEEESPLARSFTIVKEEDLEAVKAEYTEVTSVHVYSLAPGHFEDLQILTSANSDITTQYASEDPLKAWNQYGVIQSPEVRRRTGGPPPIKPAPVATTAAAKSTPRPSSVSVAKNSPSSTAADTEEKTKPLAAVHRAAIPPKSSAAVKPPAFRREKSDIFKSFAKARPKREDSAASSKEATPAEDSNKASPAEDEPMKDVSDDEEEEEDIVIPQDKEKAEAARKSKAEREEALRKMMEDDDEPMEDAPEESPEKEEDPSQGAIDEKPSEEPEAKETTTVSGGRRRGKRRVMKKKTTKDEDGYLVTTEVPVWESFSEDEPEPKRHKTPMSSSSQQSTKSKRAAGKPGQGNIMSFFQKK